MKIIFITNLTSVKSLGPSWSVPARIKYQEMIDDVLWVNCTDAYINHWGEVKCFHKLSEFGGKLVLSAFPPDYQKPDLIVFEDFYYVNCIRFHFELIKKKIPYIIVPRGALTYMAQNNNKWLKKRVANFLIFSHFLKHALCIQYLTPEEYRDSSDKWNRRHIIIPNGFSLPEQYKKQFSTNRINAVFIGRLNAYHKGLDMLIYSVKKIKEQLCGTGFKLTLYGELNRDYDLLKQQVESNGLEEIVFFGGEVFDEKKKSVLLDADLFIMTSRFEGLPMGLLEALAYGLPVVITPGTNMAEMVREANAGWVSEPTVDTIASTILNAVNDKTMYAIKGKNARELSRKYDWKSLSERFHEEVKRLL